MSILRWCRFPGTNPHENLAREEAVFDSFPEADTVLLMYVNDRSIIIGKHQNPWREIDIHRAERLGIPILRRLSGGGAVYHDTGNFVFSFMRRRDELDRKHNLGIVAEALKKMRIECALSGTYDLYASGRKISGNASCFRKNRGIHHGTLLIDTDLESMHGVLKREEPTIDTHAVASRPAQTINIRDIDSGFGIERFSQAIIEIAAESFKVTGTAEFGEDEIDAPAVARLLERNRSWEWNFGRTPTFRVVLIGEDQNRIELGVKHGLIESVEGDGGTIPSAILGCRFERDALARALPAEIFANYLESREII